MKNRQAFAPSAILLFVVSFSGSAWASKGGTGGHAGGFVKCHSPDSFEPIDIYEGRAEQGLTYRSLESLGSKELSTRLAKTVDTFKPRFFRRELASRLVKLREAYLREWFTPSFWLPNARQDASEVIKSLNLPTNCNFIQAAEFFGSEDQRLHGKLLRSLRPIDVIPRASAHTEALFFHEAFYKIAVQRRGDPDSRSIRPIVALIFSDLILGAEDFKGDAVFDRERIKAEVKLKGLISDLAFATWGNISSQTQRLPGRLSSTTETIGGDRFTVNVNGWVLRNAQVLSAKGEVIRIAAAANGTLYGLGTDGAIHRLLRDGHWARVTLDGFVTHFSISSSGVLYGMGTDGRVYFASPRGSWHHVN